MRAGFVRLVRANLFDALFKKTAEWTVLVPLLSRLMHDHGWPLCESQHADREESAQ